MALGHHLAALERLASELSMSTRLVHAEPGAGDAPRTRPADGSPFRHGRALPARAPRHPRAARRDRGGVAGPRRPGARPTPCCRRTRRRRSSSADLRVDRRIAARARGGARRRRTAARRCAGRSTSSGSTSAASICARTRRCTRRSWPSCSRRRGVTPSYASLTEDGARGAPATRSSRRRGCSPPARCDSASGRRASSRSCGAAAELIERFGAEVLPHYVISKCRVASATSSRSRCCCKEVGLLRPATPCRSRCRSCHCSRPSTTCVRAPDERSARSSASPRYRGWLAARDGGRR